MPSASAKPIVKEIEITPAVDGGQKGAVGNDQSALRNELTAYVDEPVADLETFLLLITRWSRSTRLWTAF